MKKIFYVLVAIIILSGLVMAGCAKETTTTPAQTSAPVTTTAPMTTTAPPKTTAPAATTTTAPSTAQPGIKTGGTLRIADAIGPRTSIGWFADPVGFGGGVFSNIFFNTILESDVNGKIGPGLASSYSVSDDLKTITLTLRQGVKFHDGSDLTADVLKWNIELMIAAKIGEYANVDSVDKIDNNTVRLNVKKYTNTLLNYIASTFVVSKAYYDSKGGGKDAVEAMRWNPVGTGPFKFVSFTPNVSIKGTRFDNYWEKGKPYLDAVEYYVIPDQMTRDMALQAGDMDVVGGDLSKPEYDLLQRGFAVSKGYIGTGGLVPDSKNTSSPLSSLKVRQAIDYAIDRDSIIKNLGYTFWANTSQWAMPGTATYITDLPARTYNVDKAKQLLSEAGYANGFKLTLNGSVATTDKLFATAVQGYLSKVGINMDVNIMDHASYTDLSLKGWTNGFAAGAKAIDGNMNYALSLTFTQDCAYHPSMLKPDEFQALYNTAAASKNFDPSLTQKAIRYMFDNALYLPIYCTCRGEVMNPYVQGGSFFTLHNWPSWRPGDVWLNK